MRLLASTRPVFACALACALTLVTACGGDDGNDPAPDAGPDVPSDGGPDVPSDGGPHVPPDGGPHVPPDGGSQVPPDAAPGTPAILVEPTTVSLSEGGTASIAVRLSAPPSADVNVVLIAPSPLRWEGDVLRFTPANYAAPQTLVLGAEHDGDLRDETATAIVTANGLADVDLAVTVDDDDTLTIEVQNNVVLQEGQTATLGVVVTPEPLGPVQVTVASSDTGAVTVSPQTLTFDPGNYNEAQLVTLTGVQDLDVRDEIVRVTMSSPDAAGVAIDVPVFDGDVPLAVLSAEALTLSEDDSATFTVALSHEPQQPVDIDLSLREDGIVSVSPARLVFDASNFATPQTVTVTGVDDDDLLDESVEVLLNVPGDSTVTVTVDDDDSQRLVLSTNILTVREGGSTTLTVHLAHQPSGPEEVQVSAGDPSVVSVSPAILRFDASNYDVPQTVTVTGVQDADALDEAGAVGLLLPGVADLGLAVNVEDDEQTIRVSADSLTVDEGGSAAFTVRLSQAPPIPVQIAVSSSDPAVASVSPATLDFDAASFATPQTVTVTAVPDDDSDAESATVTLVGAGAILSVAVTIADPPPPPYPVDLFVRGSFNGFELDDALVFEGGVGYGARVSLHSGLHEFKIADAAFSIARTFSISQAGEVEIALDVPTTLQPTIGEFNNTLLFAGLPGIYRFDLQAADLVAPVLTVSLDEPATYFREMYVRGTFGGFEPVDRMTYEGSGRHTALVALSQGVHEFKISDDLFNADATFSVSAAGPAAIELDTPTPLELADGFSNNTSLTISTPGVYLFDMDASVPAAPVLTITLVEAAPFAGNMYVRGGFNGFGLANELRYQGGGRYGGLVTLTQDTHAFKIADATFSPGATFSAGATTPVVIGVDEPATLTPVAEQDSDTLVTLATLGVYRFALDAADPGAPVLTVTLVEAAPLPVELYVRGDFNGFTVTDPLVFLGGVDYEARIELAAGTHEFKIADDAFSAERTFSASATGSVEIPVGASVPFVVAPGVDTNTRITIAQPGTYVFAVQVSAPTALLVTVTPDVLATSPDAITASPDASTDGASWLAAWLAALPGASPSR